MFIQNMLFDPVSPGAGGAHQHCRVNSGGYTITVGRLTCFVGNCVGLGHRLLVAQVDRGAPLKTNGVGRVSHLG